LLVNLSPLVVFDNCLFDNGKVAIDTDNFDTFLGYEKRQEESQEAKVRERLRRNKERKEQEG
jgi:hypothetical protein